MVSLARLFCRAARRPLPSCGWSLSSAAPLSAARWAVRPRAPPHFCQALQRNSKPLRCAPGRLPGASLWQRGPDLDLPAFRRFYMITARAGHTASHTSSKALPAMLARPQRSPPPGRQVLEFTRRRRLKSANQPAHITTVCGGFVAGHRLWRAGNGGERNSG